MFESLGGEWRYKLPQGQSVSLQLGPEKNRELQLYFDYAPQMISLKSLTVSLNNSLAKLSYKVITIVTSIPEHMP